MRTTDTGAVLALIASLALLAPAPRCAARPRTPPAAEEAKGTPRLLHGKVEAVNGTMITIRTREGQAVQVDAAAAMQARQSAIVVVGRAIAADGTVDRKGVLHATLIQRIKDSPALWAADR
jgi:hypothetical protein